MLDIQLLRNDLDGVAERLATRGYTLDCAGFRRLDSERKTLQTRTQDLQARRNALSRQVGVAKSRAEDVTAILDEVAACKAELETNEAHLDQLLAELDAFIEREIKPLEQAGDKLDLLERDVLKTVGLVNWLAEVSPLTAAEPELIAALAGPERPPAAVHAALERLLDLPAAEPERYAEEIEKVLEAPGAVAVRAAGEQQPGGLAAQPRGRAGPAPSRVR